MTAAKKSDDAPETQDAPQVRNENGEVSDEALLNVWVVGVQYVNPADPDGPEGPLSTSKASKSSKG